MASMLRRGFLIVKSKSILIVDDDRSILRTFSRILQRAGFLTETAESGKDAQAKIQTKNYDIALIDVILGDGNGLDLLPKIHETSPNTIKIVMTGADASEKRGEACKNGADAFLTKPVDPATLLCIFEEKLECC